MTPKCMLEVDELLYRAEKLARGSASERAQAQVLQQRARTLESRGFSSGEIRAKYAGALSDELGLNRKFDDAEYRNKFDRYLSGHAEAVEVRDFLVGQQSILVPLGAEGGFLVPNVHIPTVYEAMNQVDEILNPNVCDFTMTDSSTLQPSQVSGYNLALITAQLVAETVQQVAQVIPPVAGGTLRSDITFRASFAASLEAEQDIPGFGQKIVRAASVALARKIGQSIAAGRRGADMSGIATQLSPSGARTAARANSR